MSVEDSIRGNTVSTSSLDAEVEVLDRLRQAPELIAKISSSQEDEFSLQQKLRREYESDLVRAAMTLVDARRRGAGKFSRVSRMWLDRLGVEQSTPEAVAVHKARRFRTSTRPVFDLCCGIGADTVQLAQSAEVVAVDRRPASVWRTRRNAEVYDVAGRTESCIADVTQLDYRGRLVHIDPDRRASGQRSLRIELAEPGLDFLKSLTETAAGGAIKLSPAANFGGKFPDCELELTSLRGECKEATIWFGELRSEARFRATVLPEGASLTGDPWESRGTVGPLQRYLYDPDPAVVRAGLVDVCAETLAVQRLDAEEEYLTSDSLIASAFLTGFEVLVNLPNNEKVIRAWFRESDIGQLEIKCRHIPVAVESLRKRLELSGQDHAVLIIARVEGKSRAIIARRVLPTV